MLFFVGYRVLLLICWMYPSMVDACGWLTISVPRLLYRLLSSRKQAENAHFCKRAFSPRDKRWSETWVSFSAQFQLVLNRTKQYPRFGGENSNYRFQSVFTENEPLKSVFFHNKLTPWFLSKVWNGNERFRLVFTEMLVFMSKTGFIMPAPVSAVVYLFSIVGAQLCLYCR